MRISDWSSDVCSSDLETFPLRLLWLKKAFDAVANGVSSGTFQEQEAITRFGVGRNMAASMRYWAPASGFFTEADRKIAPSDLGQMILAGTGFDPYVERASTIWLAHCHIASSQATKDPDFYTFHLFPAIGYYPPL